jgi:hypothetical protein
VVSLADTMHFLRGSFLHRIVTFRRVLITLQLHKMEMGVAHEGVMQMIASGAFLSTIHRMCAVGAVAATAAVAVVAAVSARSVPVLHSVECCVSMQPMRIASHDRPICP